MSPLSAKGELLITRFFDAPRERVFEAWTQPEHFKNWFGPRGSTMPHLQMDAKTGGSLHFLHRLDNGQEIWIKGRFEEAVKPSRLVFSLHFSNAGGDKVERPGFNLECRVAVDFEEKGNNTKVTIRHTGLRADQGESEGWKQGLDRLAELLTTN